MSNQITQNVMHKRAKGNKGEDIACKFLIKNGFRVICRNYQKAWGEIDIIAEKDKVIHFFEVKSVTGRSSGDTNSHRPEDNVHGLKTRHIRRMIETYFEESKYGFDREFHFHVLCVYMDMGTRTARVKWIEDIIL